MELDAGVRAAVVNTGGRIATRRAAVRNASVCRRRRWRVYRLRRRVGSLLVAVLASAILASCGGPGPASGGQAPLSADLQRLVALVNEARAQPRTCGTTVHAATHPLAVDSRLMAAAHGHSADMAANGFMGHTGSDGSSVAQRVAREGYVSAQVGENVAWGYGSPEAVMAGWLGSPGHCVNIMRPGYTEIGLGLVGTHWTQVFARPR